MFHLLNFVYNATVFPVSFIFSWAYQLTGLGFIFKPAIQHNINTKQDLESKFGEIHPEIKSCSLQELIQSIKETLTPAMCFMYDNDKESSINFCKDVIFNQEISTFVDSNFIFWPCHLKSSFAIEVCATLQAKIRYPCCIFITHEKSIYHSSNIINITKISSLKFLSHCNVLLRRIEALKKREATDRARLQRDRDLKRMQDEEYHKNLKLDQERRFEIERKIQLEKQKEQKLRDDMEKKLKYKDILKKLKEQSFDRIAKRVDCSKNEQIIRFGLKFPNGVVSKYIYPEVGSTTQDLVDDLLTNTNIDALRCQYSIYSIECSHKNELFSIDLIQNRNLVQMPLIDLGMDSQVLLVEPHSSSEDESCDDNEIL